MTTTLRAPFTVAAVIIALVAACVTRLGRRVMPPARRAQDLSSGARGEAIADAPAGDATDTPGDPKGYELAYEAGLRAVEGQESSLRDIRSRATTLLNLITAVIVSQNVGQEALNAQLGMGLSGAGNYRNDSRDRRLSIWVRRQEAGRRIRHRGRRHRPQPRQRYLNHPTPVGQKNSAVLEPEIAEHPLLQRGLLITSRLKQKNSIENLTI